MCFQWPLPPVLLHPPCLWQIFVALEPKADKYIRRWKIRYWSIVSLAWHIYKPSMKHKDRASIHTCINTFIGLILVLVMGLRPFLLWPKAPIIAGWDPVFDRTLEAYSLSLSLYLSIHRFVHPSVRLSICHLSVQSIHLDFYLSIYPFIHLYMCIKVFWEVCSSLAITVFKVYLYISLDLFIHITLSIYTYHSIYLYRSLYLFIHITLSIYTYYSIYLYISLYLFIHITLSIYTYHLIYLMEYLQEHFQWWVLE